MSGHLQRLAIDQLKTVTDDIRLIVIHPRFRSQHRLLGEFLGPRAIYACFVGQNLSLPQLKSQFEVLTTAQNWQGISDTPTIVLDECDRADPSAFDQFIFYILDAFSPHRVVILGRRIPQFVLDRSPLVRQTALIPRHDSSMLCDYTRPPQGDVLLEVCALGEGQAMLNGRLIDNWDGVLPRALFFYLIDRAMATRSDIFDTFWPDKSIAEATNIFHVTKRKINEILTVDLTTYRFGYYSLSPQIDLRYDVILYHKMVQNSAVAASREEAIHALTCALALYQGHFLHTIDLPWVRNHRQELRDECSQTLATLAQLWEEGGVTGKQMALDLYCRASAFSNHNQEDLAHQAMRLCHELGRLDEALAVYDRFTEALGNNPGLSPSREFQDFARALRQSLAGQDG